MTWGHSTIAESSTLDADNNEVIESSIKTRNVGKQENGDLFPAPSAAKEISTFGLIYRKNYPKPGGYFHLDGLSGGEDMKLVIETVEAWSLKTVVITILSPRTPPTRAVRFHDNGGLALCWIGGWIVETPKRAAQGMSDYRPITVSQCRHKQ